METATNIDLLNLEEKKNELLKQKEEYEKELQELLEEDIIDR